MRWEFLTTMLVVTLAGCETPAPEAAVGPQIDAPLLRHDAGGVPTPSPDVVTYPQDAGVDSVDDGSTDTVSGGTPIYPGVVLAGCPGWDPTKACAYRPGENRDDGKLECLALPPDEPVLFLASPPSLTLEEVEAYGCTVSEP